MSDIYTAMLDDIVLDVETIEDSFSKSLAKYEFPYRDGALLEDMGQRARSVTIRCYFYGPMYAQHGTLLNHLKSRNLFELRHPKYKLLKGSVETVSVRHDDRTETAEIDITFVENLRAPETTLSSDPSSEQENGFGKGQQQQMDKFAGDAGGTLGAQAGQVLNRGLDPAQRIFPQFQDLTGTARDYVAQVDAYVGVFEHTLSDIASPANSLLATIDYGTTLPGRVIGAAAGVMERYALFYGSLKSAPTRFIQSFLDGVKEFRESLPRSSKNRVKQSAIDSLQKHIGIAAAQRVALEIAYLYKEDEDRREKARRAENRRSFDSKGNYIKAEVAEPIMTINDIEKTLADVRGAIQSAVDSAREMDSLKLMARQLLFHVNTIKLEREKIVIVELNSEMPLHLVCLKYGLPYNYAERIHAINIAGNPNFLSGKVNIYAR